nr:carbohydrate-binding protein [uncultured Niameybacter sp.]
MITLKIVSKEGLTKRVAQGKEVFLVYGELYEEGDHIVVACEEENTFLVVQLDDAIGESFIYLKNHTMDFAVPFEEKKRCYSPKSFSGKKHLLTARLATREEVLAYKNLALNKYDTHEGVGCFPHASANIETRGESVFAAKNVINGNHANNDHGSWPYESWGINRDPHATMKIDFGRKVYIDKVVLYIRADFPHDSYWTQATLTFSDQSSMICQLEKTPEAQVFSFGKKEVEWIQIEELIKADDDSPFPALSQFEVYGVEVGV